MIARWLVRVVAVASIAACIVVSVVDAARGFQSGGSYVLYGAIAIVFMVVGWLIAERRPGNAVGPLLLAFGALFAWYLPADVYLHLPGTLPATDLAALFTSVLDAPMFILIALVLVLFPTGEPPTPRWRWTLPLAAAGIASTVAGYTLSGDPFPAYPANRSPIGIAGFPGQGLVLLGYGIMLLLLATAVAALAVRWRRGTAVEQTQIKWVVAAAVVLVATELLNVVTYRPEAPDAPVTLLATVAIALVPMSMGIAILRYRLFEIDRVISRSVGYAIVTAILAGVFAGLNLLLQGVLTSFVVSESVAVAASTLAVFALFQPIRRRVQRVVDSRFDRARYDAERIAAAFSGRLRYETDMETVTDDLAGTAMSAVAPASLSIWLRGGEAGR